MIYACIILVFLLNEIFVSILQKKVVNHNIVLKFGGLNSIQNKLVRSEISHL
jgi:hypothetical protein